MNRNVAQPIRSILRFQNYENDFDFSMGWWGGRSMRASFLLTIKESSKLLITEYLLCEASHR